MLCSNILQGETRWQHIKSEATVYCNYDYGSYGLNSINTPQSHSFTGLLHNT